MKKVCRWSFLTGVSDDLKTHKLTVDDYKRAFDVTSQLMEQGYKRIAHVTFSKHLTIAQNRLNGYLDALKAHKIPVRREWIVHYDFEENNMKNEVRKLLAGKNRPNAIFSVERCLWPFFYL